MSCPKKVTLQLQLMHAAEMKEQDMNPIVSAKWSRKVTKLDDSFKVKLENVKTLIAAEY